MPKSGWTAKSSKTTGGKMVVTHHYENALKAADKKLNGIIGTIRQQARNERRGGRAA